MKTVSLNDYDKQSFQAIKTVSVINCYTSTFIALTSEHP